MTARRPRAKPQPIPVLWRRRAGLWIKDHALALLMILLGLLIGIYLSLWIVFIRPQHYIPPVECASLPLNVSLHYPYYIAARDESFVEVGVRNVGTQPITGTAVVAFGGDLSIHPLPAKTNYLSFAGLPPNGIIADQVRFSLNEPPTRLRGTLPFTVHITANGACNLDFANSPFYLTPIPGLKKSLTAILSGVVSITALAGLLWKQVEKWLFPEKKK